MASNVSDIIQVGIFGVTLGGTIIIPFIIYVKKKFDSHTAEIQQKFDKKLDDIDRRVQAQAAELLPAFKNGGIVTPETLKEHMNTLERILSEKISFLNKRLDIHNESSSAGRGLSEERLVEIIRNEIARKR